MANNSEWLKIVKQVKKQASKERQADEHAPIIKAVTVDARAVWKAKESHPLIEQLKRRASRILGL